MEDPYLNDPGYDGRGEGGPLYPGFGNITDPSRGCTQNGVYSPCDWGVNAIGGISTAFWGSHIADLPGFGTNWGSFAELGMWQYEQRLAYTRERNGMVRASREGMPRGIDHLEYVPQNSRIRDVTPILNKIRFLGDNANNKNLKSMLQDRLMQLLSKGCADAFKRAGLSTPEEIINKGITIADRPLLNDSSNNGTLGLSESTRQGFAKSQAPALTIRSQFTSKGPIIFFRAEAYADTDYLDEAVAHEFIHAAGVGQYPLTGYGWPIVSRGTDLSAYDHYQDIIDNCGFKKVLR